MSVIERMVVLFGTLIFFSGVYFLFFYSASSSNSANNKFYDSPRIHGQSIFRHKKNNTRPLLRTTKIEMKTTSEVRSRPVVIDQSINNQTNFVKWSGDKHKKIMSDDLQRHKYKRTYYSKPQIVRHKSNTIEPIYSQNVQNLNFIQSQIKKAKSKQCSYYQKMKKNIENRMRSGYSANEYNWLEGKRKYWGSKYTTNCMN
ncbi:MAG: hypothetical protein L3J59_16385 [Methylococcaceae bacterium]|nr:hypothetical protein [Methylococcaceae bacterium]